MTDTHVLLTAASRVLEQTNRLLGSDKDVTVTFTQPQNTMLREVPAWTDGKKISINLLVDPVSKVTNTGRFTGEQLMLLNGLNYHELAHTIWTPRRGSWLWDQCSTDQTFFSFNILEDQRAEMAMVGRYGPMRSYFTALVTNYMMNHKSQIKTVFPLIHGRQFLPLKLRNYLLGESVYSEEMLEEFKNIIDEYLTLDLSQVIGVSHDMYRAKELIQQFHDLLEKAKKDHGFDAPDVSHETLGGSKPRPISQQQQAGEFEELITDDNSPEGEDSSDDMGAGHDDDSSEDVDADGSGGDAETSNSSEGSADDEEGSGQGHGESGQSGEGDGDEPLPPKGSVIAGSTSNAAGQTTETVEDGYEHFSTLSVDEILESTMDELKSEVKEDLTTQRDAIADEYRNYRADASDWQYSNAPITYWGTEELKTTKEVLNLIARQVEREFEDLRTQVEEGWDYRVDEGKIDPFRVTQIGKADLEFFRRWREGIEEALDFEIILMIDLSGSMAGDKLNKASEAVWVLHKALTEIGSSVTVLGFTNHDGCQALINRGDPTPDDPRYYHCGGATYASKAFEEAGRIIEVSERSQKLVINLSDGGFSDTTQVERHVRGFPCGIAMIGVGIDLKEWSAEPNIIHVQTVTSAWDLVDFAKNLCLNMATSYMEGVH